VENCPVEVWHLPPDIFKIHLSSIQFNWPYDLDRFLSQCSTLSFSEVDQFHCFLLGFLSICTLLHSVMYKKLGQICTDSQTNKHTSMLIAILCPPNKGNVTTTGNDMTIISNVVRLTGSHLYNCTSLSVSKISQQNVASEIVLEIPGLSRICTNPVECSIKISHKNSYIFLKYKQNKNKKAKKCFCSSLYVLTSENSWLVSSCCMLD